MKILHTSDWHLGQNFKGRDRIYEHNKFLEWLLETIERKKIDVLIVAGDIFDTLNPPNYALKMYHDFLAKLIKSPCKYAFIIAGNHDSISTLEVSKDILNSLNVFVVTSGENIDDVVFKIEEIAICAVPFLRERVLKPKSLNLSEAENEIKEAIKEYYEKAYKKAKALNPKRIIATGHLTVTGASVSESEREIYIGKLKDMPKNIFEKFDYTALGHIHKPQKISKNTRYSGSPIPLSFSETEEKEVLVIDTDNLEIKKIQIPNFKKMFRVKGNFSKVLDELERIKDIDNPPFVEIYLDENVSSFKIDELRIEGVDIIAIKQKLEIKDVVLENEDIENINPLSVFEKRLEIEDLKEDEKEKLKAVYMEILKEVEDEN